MKTGTVETIADQIPVTRRTRVSPSSPSGFGGGGDGQNDGKMPDLPELNAPAEAPSVDKSRFIAWFLLLAVGMTFAGLLGAYLMVATNRAAEWKPFDLPVQIWVSTAIILFSSVTYSLAARAINRNDHLSARKWLIGTTVLGAAFISSQFLVWIDLTNRGFYLRGNPYAGFFYILTAAHLVHVAGGIIALGSIVLGSWYPPVGQLDRIRRRDLARSVGWYWHFMGILWVVLFLMLGFWK